MIFQGHLPLPSSGWRGQQSTPKRRTFSTGLHSASSQKTPNSHSPLWEREISPVSFFVWRRFSDAWVVSVKRATIVCVCICLCLTDELEDAWNDAVLRCPGSCLWGLRKWRRHFVRMACFRAGSEARNLPVGGTVFESISRYGTWKRNVFRPSENSRSYLNFPTTFVSKSCSFS
jgi:hypothetical protein